MNTETIERLLIDRSLGTLPKDVDILLDAYLANDAESAAQAAEFDRTATLARRALTRYMPVELPPFPAMPMQRERRWLRRRRWARGITAAAATLVLGVGLGAAWFRNTGHETVGGDDAILSPTRSIDVTTDVPDSSGMWSSRRMIERAARSRVRKPVRLIWDSPVFKPRIGDA